jgi:hypothetical protein
LSLVFSATGRCRIWANDCVGTTANDKETKVQDGDRLVLRDDRIIETVAMLQNRISDRFPESGLSRLCGQLRDVAAQAAQRSAWIARPIRWIRLVSYALAISLITFFVGSVLYALQLGHRGNVGFIDLVQAMESGLNDIIFFAIAIFFLFSLETRIKRRRALAAVHELRSIAHIIDMHQLTKDPERTLPRWSDAKHSPKQQMTALELNRYLDYCSEMLSLTGKIAALYVQQFDDAHSVAAVSEVEQLSTGLSRKIWQKIMILQQLRESSDSRGFHSAVGSDAPTPRQDSSDEATRGNRLS